MKNTALWQVGCSLISAKGSRRPIALVLHGWTHPKEKREPRDYDRHATTDMEEHGNIGRIIAAAPSLLAAAKRVLDWADAGCDPSTKAIDQLREAFKEAQ